MLSAVPPESSATRPPTGCAGRADGRRLVPGRCLRRGNLYIVNRGGSHGHADAKRHHGQPGREVALSQPQPMAGRALSFPGHRRVGERRADRGIHRRRQRPVRLHQLSLQADRRQGDEQRLGSATATSDNPAEQGNASMIFRMGSAGSTYVKCGSRLHRRRHSPGCPQRPVRLIRTWPPCDAHPFAASSKSRGHRLAVSLDAETWLISQDAARPFPCFMAGGRGSAEFGTARAVCSSAGSSPLQPSCTGQTSAAVQTGSA
jgi:hypothetical protein